MYIIDDNKRVRYTKGVKEKYTLDFMQVVRAIVARHDSVLRAWYIRMERFRTR